MSEGWQLYGLPDEYLAALKLWGYDSPAELRKNRTLFARVVHYAIRCHYKQLCQYAGRRLTRQVIRRILARVFNLSPERVKSVLYKKGGQPNGPS